MKSADHRLFSTSGSPRRVQRLVAKRDLVEDPHKPLSSHWAPSARSRPALRAPRIPVAARSNKDEEPCMPIRSLIVDALLLQSITAMGAQRFQHAVARRTSARAARWVRSDGWPAWPRNTGDVMVIVLVGTAGWLLIFTIAMSLSAAAKRGDDLHQSARRYLPDSRVDQIIPFDRAAGRETLNRAGRRSSAEGRARSRRPAGS